LRSGKDILTKGGHVTLKLTEKTFRLCFDNKRAIVLDKDNPLVQLRDSRPHIDKDTALLYRIIAKLNKSKYALNSGYPLVGSNIKSFSELILRQFLRGALQNKFDYQFQPYDKIALRSRGRMHSIKEFYHDPLLKDLFKLFGVNISKAYVYNNKNRPFITKSVPRIKVTLSIRDKLIELYPGLNVDILFKD